jgi:hypothetical protein
MSGLDDLRARQLSLGGSPSKNIFIPIVETQIHDFRQLNDSIERLLEDEVKRAHKRVEKTRENASDQTQSDAAEYLAELEYIYGEMFPSMIRSSLLVSCYSLLESSLAGLCEWLSSERSLEQPLLRSRGSVIQKAKGYLSRIIRLSIPAKSPFWKELILVGQIRNRIVHFDGRLGAISPAMASYLKDKNEYLTTDASGRVVAGRGYISHISETMQQLFRSLKSAIPDPNEGSLSLRELSGPQGTM